MADGITATDNVSPDPVKPNRPQKGMDFTGNDNNAMGAGRTAAQDADVRTAQSADMKAKPKNG